MEIAHAFSQKNLNNYNVYQMRIMPVLCDQNILYRDTKTMMCHNSLLLQNHDHTQQNNQKITLP